MANLPPKMAPPGELKGLVVVAEALLASEELSASTKDAIEAALTIERAQQDLLNQKLKAIGHMAQYVQGDPAAIASLQEQIDALDTGGWTVYELPILGPIVGISGTTFLAITLPAVVGHHATSEALRFWWRAGDTGATARWRLRNETAGVTMLSGSRLAPFDWTLEEVTAGTSGALMPAAGDEVSLEVAFSAVNLGGMIDLRGPATWRVS